MLESGILIIIEVMSFIALKEWLFNRSGKGFFIITGIHFSLSIMLWYFLIKVLTFRGFYDEPENVVANMNLMGMVSAVVFPRFILVILHFTGKLLKYRKRGFIPWLTGTGFIISTMIFVVIAAGAFVGRFNFKTEEITITISGLRVELNGLRIVQLSDMHLASFYKHPNQLEGVVEKVNNLNADLIINTGDFVTFGWREYDRCDTILIKSKSRFGNFAVPGNHDEGTYLPVATADEREANAEKVIELIAASGYEVLADKNVILEINGIKVAFIGVTTSGRHPFITHGNPDKAAYGTDSADFKILLAHDPNQWEEEIKGKTDIDLTLSGHTHGMQMGIITKKFRWSPAKYFYPHWNGLFSEGDQYLYVNRGLGVLAIPFRIWMPPEITVITLMAE